MNGTASFWIPKVITESIADSSVDEADTSKTRERGSSHHSLTPSPEQSFGKKLPQYNSFRVMKQKVSTSNCVECGRNVRSRNVHVIVGEEGFKTSSIPLGSEYTG